MFWPEVRRGTERFTRELADGLQARGHHPRLITSHPRRPTRTVEDGLPIVRVPRPPDARFTRRRFEEHLTHLPFAYAALRTGRDDVAHAMFPTDALVAARWARATGRPSILSYMGIPDHEGLRYKRRRLEITQRCLRECDAVVALSRAAADAFDRWLGAEVHVIEPGVNLGAFTPGAGRSPAPAIFCGAAITEPRKNVKLLVEAFGIVRDRRPDARLLLSRPSDPEAAEQVGAVGPGIELVDVDDRAALAQRYREAWVSVLPSFGEAFGLVLAEALACGTPVVGSDLGGIPEIIGGDERIGRLFDGRDVTALAHALLETLELAEDPATPGHCRARAERFSTDRTTERYLELYSELRSRR